MYAGFPFRALNPTCESGIVILSEVLPLRSALIVDKIVRDYFTS